MQKSNMGRPKCSRRELLAEVQKLPRVGRRQVQVNARVMAERVGRDRGTVRRMLRDLETDGHLTVLANGGKVGLRVLLKG